ncbi:hypothetical protein A946_10715 [Methylacidiphilum kamchatkense Kam1]|uniref:Uncharacterized protein n=1 Tax=Methylacidiphilum kamchatkense Kam1 TaxID=1202785 RepID=A0ABR4ZUP6_9BACT|nr:hypothetical protein A946_10715 [Methylacidiphilum kamchatkense Kam1]
MNKGRKINLLTLGSLANWTRIEGRRWFNFMNQMILWKSPLNFFLDFWLYLEGLLSCCQLRLIKKCLLLESLKD